MALDKSRTQNYSRRCMLSSWLCFIEHLLVEIVCFTVVTHTFKLTLTQGALIALLYDILAFYPQFIIGELHEKFKKVDFGSIAVGIIAIGIIVVDWSAFNIRTLIGIALIAIGNAFIHDCCAIQTTLLSNSKLFPSALYVGGGSFGVVIGQYLGKLDAFNKYYLLIALVGIELIILLTNKFWLYDNKSYPEFNLTKPELSIVFVVVAAFVVTLVRSFMGYAIPISWKKEEWQSFVLFSSMGVGKAFGGWLADKIGTYKVGVATTLLAIPFLVFGDTVMMVSIIGVFLFSMTMSITFGMLLSVIKDNPGFAFGLTTIALTTGILPVLLFGSFDKLINIILVVVLSLLCVYLLHRSLRRN